ncbi:TetR/AcrR family transcriptional regulator [Actinomadura sp. ATCC 31491]|uniref:TetR/AcrR family transcriptional regulator n=1 Tax=Actinomadura luzonensis TaxID=2805427 RepID=A0ABT0G2M5_9ACTN|nr:TetR/AcrR family transcriptional regulator [Actinomadura luzonensis]MCK2218759.1 TetR/AcrR family transcriptional regulator [Actinomadura luzonensis]
MPTPDPRPAPPAGRATTAGAARPMRADARRNHDRLLAAAAEAVAEQGAEASLEEIARRAGVGSATLHRHFPSRQRLLEALFRGKVEALCAAAGELAARLAPGPALDAWLRAVAAHAVSNRGLAAALLRGGQDGDPTLGATCHTMITETGADLLARARRAGAVRPEVGVTDLLKLVNAIALAAEGEPDGAAQAERLLTLALDGVRPPGDSPGR